MTGEQFYEGFIFVRSQKMGGKSQKITENGKRDVIMLVIMLLIRTKCEAIKCIGQKQSKGG